MDLFVVKGPRGLILRLGRVADWPTLHDDVVAAAKWPAPRDDVAAVFPSAGQLADSVLNALGHDDRLAIQAPLSCVLAAVAHAIADDEGDSVCSHCRAREAPADPSGRPTEEALDEHAGAARSRSPMQARARTRSTTKAGR
jgi:hypothetical protein